MVAPATLTLGSWVSESETLCAVYLYIYLSITSRKKKEEMNTRVHKRVEKMDTLKQEVYWRE